MKKVFLGLIGFLVSIAILFGIFIIISSISNPTKKVVVDWTEEDWQSYLQKGNIIISPDMASVDDILTNRYEIVGTVDIDTFVTNEEVTAMINMTTRDAGIFQDVNMRYLGNNRMEVSAVIGDNIETLMNTYPEVKKYEDYIKLVKGRSIYMKTTLEHTTGNNFEARIESLRIGVVPLPVNIVNKNMVGPGTEINNLLNDIEGLSIERFDITEEGFHFKGAIPQHIKKLP